MKLEKNKEMEEQVASWWGNFKEKKCSDARNNLLVHYHPIVKGTAERLSRRLPDEVDVDDLIQAGTFGLLDALKAFDKSRGVKFETYCTQRIQGAILDELRAMDWVPRLVRYRSNKYGTAHQKLEAQLGRKPTDREIARELKITQAEYTKLKRDSKANNQVSLNRTCYENDSTRDVREIDIVEDHRCDDPFDFANRRDMKELVTRGLSRAERLIVILYYYEDLTMKEIGKTLALSESRVSQMHSAIIKRLRNMLSKKQRELEVV